MRKEHAPPFFAPISGPARNGKQGKCGHTCYFCSQRGPQKRLLGSLPKPSSAQAPHLSQLAKADFLLALLHLLSPLNPLVLGFNGGLDVIV